MDTLDRLATLPATLTLVLALDCGGHGSGTAAAPAPQQAVLESTPLDRLFHSDSRFGPRVQQVLRTVVMDPVLGQGLREAIQAAGGPDGSPDPDHILKAMAAPATRPLLMAAIDQDFLDRSRALKAAHRANPHDPGFTYDVVVVGGGPNGEVAALNLHVAQPALRVAVLDENKLPGDVFRNLGTFTWINSPELPAASTNEFPGLAVTAKDLLAPGTVQGGPFFLTAKDICDLCDLAAFASGVDFWLSTGASAIRRHHGRLEVVTADPALALTAVRVLVTTGLGRQPHYGLPPGSVQPEPPGPGKVPAQEHFDPLVGRGARMILANQLAPQTRRVSFLAPYAGRTIAIIGAGDSANNLAEVAAGLGPPVVYGLPAGTVPPQPGPKYGPGIGEPEGPARVYWVNQSARNGDEFKARNKPRYHQTLPSIFDRFTRTEFRLGSVHRATDGTFTLDLVDHGGSPRGEIHGVDYIWYGTGYRITSSPLIRHLVHPGGGMVSAADAAAFIRGLEEVRGTIQVTAPGPHLGTEITTAIGRKLPDTDPLEGVFFGGTVALPLATDQELKDYTVTRNPASLNANLPRAAALGRYLAGLPGYRHGPPPHLPARPPSP
jgi:hypothetical protein